MMIKDTTVHDLSYHYFISGYLFEKNNYYLFPYYYILMNFKCRYTKHTST